MLDKGDPARRSAGYFLATVLQPGVAHFMSRSGGNSLPALHVAWRRLCPKRVTRVASVVSTRSYVLAPNPLYTKTTHKCLTAMAVGGYGLYIPIGGRVYRWKEL